MKKSLYSILDVDKLADKKTIKNAYRKCAKKNHPDTGGNPERFAVIKRAHDILMDDERRNKYDSTGDESEKSPDNVLGNIINCIAYHLNTVLGDCAQSGTSPLTVDVVSKISSKMRSTIQENEKNLRITKGVLDFDKKMQGRFKNKNKSNGNIFEDIISHRISSLQMNISQLENAIKTHEEALEMIKGFSYKSDKPDYEPSNNLGFSYFTNGSNW